MTFEGQYLTYAEYTELGGSAMAEMPFNILEFEARKKIDGRTQERLVGQEIPKEVKMCEFAIIETALDEIKRKQNSGASSESIDGYSITYLSPSEVQQVMVSKAKQIEDIMQTYLLTTKINNVPIMYRGL